MSNSIKFVPVFFAQAAALVAFRQCSSVLIFIILI